MCLTHYCYSERIYESSDHDQMRSVGPAVVSFKPSDMKKPDNYNVGCEFDYSIIALEGQRIVSPATVITVLTVLLCLLACHPRSGAKRNLGVWNVTIHISTACC